MLGATSGAPLARAQAPAPDSAAVDAARTRAQDHLSRGNDLFTNDRFAAALDEFQAAYTAFPSPKLRFNMGQCLRALGRRAEALDEFRRFVEETQDVAPELRQEAERYIGELKGAEAMPLSPLPASPPAALPPAPPPEPLVSMPPADNPTGASRPIYKRWWFWTAIAVAAGATVGVLLLRPRDPPCQTGVMCL